MTRVALPAHERERLLTVATGRSRAERISTPALSAEERERFDELVGRRLAGEPLQYLEGSVDFGPLTLHVDRRALIPRQETEQLYEAVTGALCGTDPGVIVDLGTGCGNLALALKHDFPAARVLGVDVSAEAVSLARENSVATGLEVDWIEGDLLAALPRGLRGAVDALISNPPYVAIRDRASLPTEVVDHEPAAALFADEDGLAALRRIATEAREWVRPGGLVACEIGSEQGQAAAELFEEYDGTIGFDLSGRPRWFLGRHT